MFLLWIVQFASCCYIPLVCIALFWYQICWTKYLTLCICLGDTLKLQQQLLKLDQHVLINDVVTRWKSTNDISEWFYEQKSTLYAVITSLKQKVVSKRLFCVRLCRWILWWLSVSSSYFSFYFLIQKYTRLNAWFFDVCICITMYYQKFLNQLSWQPEYKKACDIVTHNATQNFKTEASYCSWWRF